ncbi:hypothetical protein NR798_23980 [Archangium gephyra]|uniref:kelch repeat-containing protein n=1 Tax=Archangium gephyra TaxID=48 RepID=UPI0035D4A54F
MKHALSALLLLSLGTPALAQESLVINGGFESPALPRGSWSVFGSIPGWAGYGSGIEIQAFGALEGSQVVELDSHGPSSMYQIVYPKPGALYELSVAYSPRPGVRDNRISVRFGDLSTTLQADGSSLGSNQWTRHTFRVRATDAEMMLVFQDTSVADSLGGLLDDVRLEEVVAEQCGTEGAGQHNPAGSTAALHLQHTATLLADGRVLATGGFGTTAELYSPATRAWTVTGNTNTTRRLHTATLLEDGRVLVVGGDDSGASATSEVYDPTGGYWLQIGRLVTPRRGHAAVRLSKGRVLVFGGVDDSGRALDSAEIYDVARGIWYPTGRMKFARRGFTATELQWGDRVLVTGGVVDGGDECLGTNCLSTAEVYDAATGTWTSTGSLATARGFHSATLLSNGQVLVTGGSLDGAASARAELYNPLTGTWTSTGNMSSPRRRHTLSTLANGWVLAAGGYDASTGIHSSAELYDPDTGLWCPTANMGQNRYEHTATVLQDGRVLLTAGFSTASQYTSEVFTQAGLP